jgi:hypothetical protein
LLHLTQDISNWGLLWTHNAFIYESMNGILNRFIHGTKLIPKAAVHALTSMQYFKIQQIGIKFQFKEVQQLFDKLQHTNIK